MNMVDIFFLAKGSSICQGIISPSYANWGHTVCQVMFLHFNTEVVRQKHTIECLVLFISSSSSARARVVLNSITIVIIGFLFQISTENCLRTFQTNLLAQIHNFSEQWGIERVAQLNRLPAFCQILLICWSWCLDTESKASSTSAHKLCLVHGCPKSRAFEGRKLSQWLGIPAVRFSWNRWRNCLHWEPWLAVCSALGASSTCLPILILVMKDP